MNEEAVTHDANSEAVLVGSAVMSTRAADYAATIVALGDFYRTEYATAWEIIRKLRRDRVPATSAAVVSELIARGKDPKFLNDAMGMVASTEPEAVRYHAERVRGFATRRRVVVTCKQMIQRAENPETDSQTLASLAATELAKVRDTGDNDDISIRSLAEIMATEDDPYDWVIPGVLERGDRLILTGGEGGGKSTMLRQIAICAAGGVHPFTHEPIEPARVVYIDVENTERHFRRMSRGLVAQAKLIGADPTERMFAEFPGRLDITTDRALSGIHKILDAVQPDLVVIGPLYKLSPRAIQTDDEATPLLVALDSIRDRGIALLMEAHAGHAQSAAGQRNYRPRGSSALLGWPEFGYGLELDPEAEGMDRQIIMRPWRGDRDERDWPTYFRSGGLFPWTPIRTTDSVPAWRPLRQATA
jgi:hypothetical protein